MTDSPTPSRSDSKWRVAALILLPLVGILLVIIAIYLVRPRDPGVVTVVYSDGHPDAAQINVGAVIDATNPRDRIEPRLGHRYKVFIEDESDDRTSGIARLGGRATFIPGGRRGQTALIDVTRVRDRVIDAVMVRVVSSVDLPPKPADSQQASFVPPPGDPTAHIVAETELDVTITEASLKNPDTEGVARVAGLVIFVDGATTIGERVNVRILERRERMAFAEVTGKSATTPSPAAAKFMPFAAAAPSYQPPEGDRAAHVVPGAEMDVTITEHSAKLPGHEGVARVAGLVVFVENATTIGERVNIRITERRERMAFAVPTGKPVADKPKPAAYTPPKGDRAAHVISGAEMDVTITEASLKNPDTEGVARVAGLVVFVEGATTIGERVNIRITDRRERMAFAQVTEKAAAEPKPAASYTPPADDPSAHVVPGATLEVTITEASLKNPDTEGVARVEGLVVFVEGATAIGETHSVVITGRRERFAFAKVVPASPNTP